MNNWNTFEFCDHRNYIPDVMRPPAGAPATNVRGMRYTRQRGGAPFVAYSHEKPLGQSCSHLCPLCLRFI